MKKIFLACFGSFIPLFIFSQINNKDVTEDAFLKRGYVSNVFVENCFLALGGGVQVYNGEHDNKAKDEDRLSPALAVSIGKWFSPAFGARLTYNGLQLKQYSLATGSSTTSGTDLVEDKINSGYVHFDVMFNLFDGLGKYRENRFYTLNPYLGAGIMHMWNGPARVDYAMNAGLLNRFRLSNKFDLQIDAMIGAVNGAFDGDNTHKFDLFVSGNVGLIYKFGKSKKWQGVSEYNPYANDDYVAQVDSLNKRINEIRSELTKERRRSSVSLKNTRYMEDLIYAAYVSKHGKSKTKPCTLFFEYEDNDVQGRDMMVLSHYVKTIKSAPEDASFVISYFDIIGEETSETERSRKMQRANSIKDILMKRFNIDGSKLSVSKSDYDFDDENFSNVILIQKR